MLNGFEGLSGLPRIPHSVAQLDQDSVGNKSPGHEFLCLKTSEPLIKEPDGATAFSMLVCIKRSTLAIVT